MYNKTASWNHLVCCNLVDCCISKTSNLSLLSHILDFLDSKSWIWEGYYKPFSFVFNAKIWFCKVELTFFFFSSPSSSLTYSLPSFSPPSSSLRLSYLPLLLPLLIVLLLLRFPLLLSYSLFLFFFFTKSFWYIFLFQLHITF